MLVDVVVLVIVVEIEETASTLGNSSFFEK